MSYSDIVIHPQLRIGNLHSVRQSLSVACDPDRHSRIVSALRISKLDAFVCSLPTKVLLLTGYWPVMGTSAAIFTAEGAVHLVVPSDEEELAKESSLAERTVFLPARLDSITDAETAIRQPLFELCRKLSLGSMTVGIETGQFQRPCPHAVASSYRSGLQHVLRSEFPNLGLAPADSELERLRATKTTWELRKIRTAACIARTAFETGD